MIELMRMKVDGKDGQEEYSIRLLQRFGELDPYVTPNKIQEIWLEYSQHDVLFSDYTAGSVEPFLDMLFDPRAIIAEVFRVDNGLPYGLVMMNRVIPRFDALGHFNLWDSKVRGKEIIFWRMMELWMNEFDLHRLSAETPVFMRGVIRMIERLGFKEEGTRREGTIHKGEWMDLKMYGILRSELEDILKEA